MCILQNYILIFVYIYCNYTNLQFHSYWKPRGPWLTYHWRINNGATWGNHQQVSFVVFPQHAEQGRCDEVWAYGLRVGHAQRLACATLVKMDIATKKAKPSPRSTKEGLVWTVNPRGGSKDLGDPLGYDHEISWSLSRFSNWWCEAQHG